MLNPVLSSCLKGHIHQKWMWTWNWLQSKWFLIFKSEFAGGFFPFLIWSHLFKSSSFLSGLFKNITTKQQNNIVRTMLIQLVMALLRATKMAQEKGRNDKFLELYIHILIVESKNKNHCGITVPLSVVSIERCRIWPLGGKIRQKSGIRVNDFIWQVQDLAVSRKNQAKKAVSGLKIDGCMHWLRIDGCSCTPRTRTNKDPVLVWLWIICFLMIGTFWFQRCNFQNCWIVA